LRNIKLNNDRIYTLGRSEIQHGPYNDRVYLMHMDPKDSNNVIQFVLDLAEKNKYSKIIAKVPGSCLKDFTDRGFIEEAMIPQFLKGKEHLYFLAKYFSDDRQKLINPEQINKIKKASDLTPKHLPQKLPGNYEFREATIDDSDNIALIYSQIFKSYPFPIMDPDFIVSNISFNVRYFMVWNSGKIVSIAAAEMNPELETVEMTDFATLPEHRGKKFGSYLLWKMEQGMISSGYYVGYTICRANSYGINITFGRRGFMFGGLLINNTNISGEISSMNVWYKHLLKQQY